ncbi:MAG TPA: hypothetical protein VFF03_13490 [Rhodocyclaceae bacterium]|nr:hypothetical protein [Rhodocyclaceae bacterium]
MADATIRVDLLEQEYQLGRSRGRFAGLFYGVVLGFLAGVVFVTVGSVSLLQAVGEQLDASIAKAVRCEQKAP